MVSPTFDQQKLSLPAFLRFSVQLLARLAWVDLVMAPVYEQDWQGNFLYMLAHVEVQVVNHSDCVEQPGEPGCLALQLGVDFILVGRGLKYQLPDGSLTVTLLYSV